MIGTAELLQYTDRNVKVAVPHLFDPQRLFWYYGKLITIYEHEIILKQAEKLKAIAIKHILAIEPDTRSR